MDSFYGGKPGVSFVLKGKFSSIDAMAAEFRKGSNYRDVWYEEYCIIDTPNKNDIDNGKIFQRGLNYNGENGGAIYVGQVVGPSSGTPYFQLNTLNEVKKRAKEQPADLGYNVYKRYPKGWDSATGKYLISEGGDGSDLQYFPFSTAHDHSLVPGVGDARAESTSPVDGKKYLFPTEYKDQITWTWCNIRKDNADADSWFYVGFEIPYKVTDYSAHQISPYDEHGNIKTSLSNDIKRVDDKTHPFYEHWNLGLPKGIKGDTIRNLRVITPTASNVIYDVNSIVIDTTTNSINTSALRQYAGKQDDIDHQRQIVVFDYYFYDKKANPDPLTFYVGDFNIIKEVSVSNDGTLTLKYTHNNASIFSKKIKWVKDVSLTTAEGATGGKFTLNYNNGDPAYTTQLVWVKSIDIAQDGSITYHYAGKNAEKLTDQLQWVENVTLNPNTGLFEVLYNNGKNGIDSTLTQLDWIDNLYINAANGEIAVRHVNSTKNTSAGNAARPAAQVLSAKLKLITAANVTTDGQISFLTNTGEKIYLVQDGTTTRFKVKIIENVSLTEGLFGNKRIQVKYNTETSPIAIGDPINYIQDMYVRPSDYHLLVLFNDPEHRAVPGDLDSAGMATNTSSLGNPNSARYKNVHGTGPWVNLGTTAGTSVALWRDYGAIKDQGGVLVGFNLSRTQLQDTAADYGLQPTTEIIPYLDARWPNGLTGEDSAIGGANVKAKIVTFSEDVTDEKRFYAYDYNLRHWYYLGRISASELKDAKLVHSNPTAAEIAAVSTDGLVFRTYNYTNVKTTALPSYWDRQYNGWV